MGRKNEDIRYEAISPGTVGVSQRISSSYIHGEIGSGIELRGLVFLSENDVMSCSQNQY